MAYGSMKFLIFAVLLAAPSALAATPPMGAELAFKTVNFAGRTYLPLATRADRFAGEELGNSVGHPCLRVIYLGDRFPLQRDTFRVVIKDGLVYRVMHGPQGNITGGALITPVNHPYDY